jgi:diaminopimelate epimerase
MLPFTKMNGAGNDFVMLDNRARNVTITPEAIARICDRHRGVGADGILVVEPAANGADFRMRYYNADGGEAEMCGNGARCFARFASKIAGAGDAVSFETMAGIIRARILEDSVELQMSEPADRRPPVTIEIEGESLTVHSINTGVPHAVVFVENLDDTPVARWGAALRRHSHFAPRGTNVNFVRQIDPHTIAIRTYERGVEAETLACGTGVVASALIFHQTTGAASPVTVQVRGGDSLSVQFAGSGDHIEDVRLIGPADFVFEGSIDL